MAQSQPQQGGASTPAPKPQQQQQQQQGSAPVVQQGQPLFKDWASI